MGCSAEVLNVIAKICDHVRERDDPRLDMTETTEALNSLERRLICTKPYINHENESELSILDQDVMDVAELYRLAGLIYLYRAGKKFSSSKPNVKLAVDDGFKIAARLGTCTRAFPLVILGCDARCDDDRIIILELFRKTQNNRKVGNLTRAQQFIEAFWAQDDMHPTELDYVTKLDGIISQSKDFPSFA
jgi:hypothetical protein